MQDVIFIDYDNIKPKSIPTFRDLICRVLSLDEFADTRVYTNSNRNIPNTSDHSHINISYILSSLSKNSADMMIVVDISLLICNNPGKYRVTLVTSDTDFDYLLSKYCPSYAPFNMLFMSRRLSSIVKYEATFLNVDFILAMMHDNNAISRLEKYLIRCVSDYIKYNVDKNFSDRYLDYLNCWTKTNYCEINTSLKHIIDCLPRYSDVRLSDYYHLIDISRLNEPIRLLMSIRGSITMDAHMKPIMWNILRNKTPHSANNEIAHKDINSIIPLNSLLNDKYNPVQTTSDKHNPVQTTSDKHNPVQNLQSIELKYDRICSTIGIQESLARSGPDHNPIFECTMITKDGEYKASAVASTKKRARYETKVKLANMV